MCYCNIYLFLFVAESFSLYIEIKAKLSMSQNYINLPYCWVCKDSQVLFLYLPRSKLNLLAAPLAWWLIYRRNTFLKQKSIRQLKKIGVERQQDVRLDLRWLKWTYKDKQRGNARLNSDTVKARLLHLAVLYESCKGWMRILPVNIRCSNV